MSKNPNIKISVSDVLLLFLPFKDRSIKKKARIPKEALNNNNI